MPAEKNKINLLPQEEFEGTTLGRILKWALSTFRVMVIAMEMIVMLAFLSRFWLDAHSNDLNDLIKAKSAVISSQADFEKEVRDTQKRLSLFSDLTKKTTSASDNLSTISNLLPANVVLTSFSQTESSVQIKGASSSEIAIAQLLANLENSNKFKDVALSNLDSSAQNQSNLLFTLKINVNEIGKETN